MNPLVDHRPIYHTCLKGPAAVIRLFEPSFGKSAVWEPPPPHQLEQRLAALSAQVDPLQLIVFKSASPNSQTNSTQNATAVLWQSAECRS